MGEEDPSEFKSFRDLMRSQGGDGAEDASKEKESGDRGWTLESEDDQATAESFGDGADAGGSRERIQRRPAAFGPMDHGLEEAGDVVGRRVWDRVQAKINRPRGLPERDLDEDVLDSS